MKRKILQFSSGVEVGGKSFYDIFLQAASRKLVAGKRLFRLCGFVVTSYGTSKSFSFVFLKQHSLDDLRSSDVFYIEKLLHKCADGNFLQTKIFMHFCGAVQNELYLMFDSNKNVWF
jgi:hypothetical protein